MNITEIIPQQYIPIEDLDPKKFIIIKGARVNNLKNIDVAIPRNKLVVITGLSGSGKSSLAFDTLFAEGQRMYVESLSSYTRQFLGRMEKPDVDYIKGISPAIAIEQKVSTKNPRSTVGTTTEIYDYLKLLYARIGITYSPKTDKEVTKDTVSSVVDYVFALEESQRVMILTPFLLKNERTLAQEMQVLIQKGYTRIVVDGEVKFLEELLDNKEALKNLPAIDVFTNNYKILIDRVSVKKEANGQPDEETQFRLSDSVQTAFFEGEGTCFVEIAGGETKAFSNRFEADGILFEEPSLNLFSFNNPYGACKRCDGFGRVLGIDNDLVFPDKSVSVYEGAIAPWRTEKMGEHLTPLIRNATKFDFPIHRPYKDLTQEQKDLLWTGNQYFHGLDWFFKMIEGETYKIQYRVMLSRYRGRTVCPECKGSRLRKDAGYVKIGGKSVIELVLMPISDVANFFEELQLLDYQYSVSKRILQEITTRLEYMNKVGLGYLSLNRLTSTLSGGEFQRIKLATSLGSALVGSMYILDEPSIGLHPRDTLRLVSVLESLRDMGNTVIVVEHEEEVMRAADQIIDIGPDAGSHGGELIFQGSMFDARDSMFGSVVGEDTNHGTEGSMFDVGDSTFGSVVGEDTNKGTEHFQPQTSNIESRTSKSHTINFLNGTDKIEVPKFRRKFTSFIEVKGAYENNLKDISVKFPLGILTVVTGVSGSGKSSLVRKVLYPALGKHLGTYSEESGKFGELAGSIKKIEAVEMVDQNPIGKSSRSNPVTYVKAYDQIRLLYSEQPIAKARGYKPGNFSFNVEGGRCETCQGEGFVTIEMQFMADVKLKCESCQGKRFKQEVLDIKYQEKDISEILDMTVDEAIELFQKDQPKLAEKLLPLQEVGLGYIKMGQSSNSLSGGEAQRVKLASFLGKGNPNKGKTLFIFDEPTTGLHFHDIKKLLKAINALVEQGDSVIIIEHNMEVIKSADHIIDIGPEGGENGGYITFEGTPEAMVKIEGNYTAEFLKGKV